MKLNVFCNQNNLKIVHSAGIEEINLRSFQTYHCGLQLAGYYEHFVPSRMCLIGLEEISYLRTLDGLQRIKAVETLVKQNISAILLTDKPSDFAFILNTCKRYDCILLYTEDSAYDAQQNIHAYLNKMLRPWVALHGVMVEVYGMGVLIRGESGIGKSESALELINRGSRFIADDLVKISRTSEGTLITSAMSEDNYYMEIRGLGIIDVRECFGLGSVYLAKELDLIVHLVRWDERFNYDRLGDKVQYTNILHTDIVTYELPVTAGRNIAGMIEGAALRTRAMAMGHDFVRSFKNRFDV